MSGLPIDVGWLEGVALSVIEGRMEKKEIADTEPDGI